MKRFGLTRDGWITLGCFLAFLYFMAIGIYQIRDAVGVEAVRAIVHRVAWIVGEVLYMALAFGFLASLYMWLAMVYDRRYGLSVLWFFVLFLVICVAAAPDEIARYIIARATDAD